MGRQSIGQTSSLMRSAAARRMLARVNGRFRAPQEYATGAGPYSIAIGDLNGDGKQDLATANLDANTVSVLLNKRDGTFRRERRYPTADSPESVAIGDLNGDGKADLAIASVNEQPSRVYVLFNRGHK